MKEERIPSLNKQSCDLLLQPMPAIHGSLNICPHLIWPTIQNRSHPLQTCTVQVSSHIAVGAPSKLGPHPAIVQAACPAHKKSELRNPKD